MDDVFVSFVDLVDFLLLNLTRVLERCISIKRACVFAVSLLVSLRSQLFPEFILGIIVNRC